MFAVNNPYDTEYSDHSSRDRSEIWEMTQKIVFY